MAFNKKEYQKKYYLKNKNRLKKSMKEYRKKHSKRLSKKAIKWNKENKERRKEIANKYHHKNKEHYKKYREENAEKIKGMKKAWYEKNKEHALKKTEIWHKNNPEKAKASRKKYAKKNKGLYLIHCNNRRTRKKENGGHITLEEWNDLKGQYDYICPMCGLREPEIILTIDHIVPLSKGGTGWIYNIQPLCGSCNSIKGTRILKVAN